MRHHSIEESAVSASLKPKPAIEKPCRKQLAADRRKLVTAERAARQEAALGCFGRRLLNRHFVHRRRKLGRDRPHEPRAG
jgi:hypothetical protein